MILKIKPHARSGEGKQILGLTIKIRELIQSETHCITMEKLQRPIALKDGTMAQLSMRV